MIQIVEAITKHHSAVERLEPVEVVVKLGRLKSGGHCFLPSQAFVAGPFRDLTMQALFDIDGFRDDEVRKGVLRVELFEFGHPPFDLWKRGMAHGNNGVNPRKL